MEMTGIKVYDERDYQLYGKVMADGFRSAYNCGTKTKGVVDEDGNFFRTLPLDGWRSRNLAEAITGIRDQQQLTAGYTKIVTTSTIQDLPGFDGGNTDYVNEVANKHVIVYMQVVEVDPSYGCHIILTPVV